MAKQLNVNLAFTADTSQAQANIKMLQQDLAKIANTTTPANMPLNKEMQQAVASAKELQRHLSNALDAKTGNINLNALNTSLKNSNTNLGTLTGNLLKAGSNGEQAFMSVQRAITSSNVQINQANSALGNFLTTLKNTARWQISSSVLHGFMGTIQSAWHYAQNLDKSLNNIRIVTGASADEMARFADQANKTAKALSTTTTNYTNASLIYYQQGLNDSEVKERTDVTIKMANVANESAETVSTQMTAVWNNFDDGSKSLEYYADVMTALGAATASSTAEISEGLQKFASVAETVGLSYEYATSALATITATTRESASVVGTALKTLFARIQGLQLGETLEDGVDLNKYSEALDKIGVSIFEANGEMKTMDSILEETAAKWDTMAKSEQMALAQTVAGVRQYTQFMALMENWDFMEQNLDVAYGAEGTLDVQADIYAESWEAASKRARAAMESLYNDLIPTDFIVGLTDGFGDFITMIDAVVDGMGGLPTILMLVSSIILNKMGPSLAQTFDNGIQKVSQFNTKLQETGHANFIGGALSTGFNKLTHTIQNSNQAASDLNSKLNEINSTKVGEQTGLFSDNASKTIQMSQSMVKTAIAAQGVSDAFKQYQGHTAQILNYQNLIEQSTKYMTAAERESLSVAQQELAAINEKMYAENQITQSLQAQAEARANNVDTEMLVNTYSTQGGIGYDSKMSQSMYNGATQVNNSWKELGLTIQNVNGQITTVAKSEEALSAGYTKAIKQLDLLYQLNRQIRDIQSDTKNTDITQRNAAIKELINKEEYRKNIAKEVLDMYSKGGTIKSGNELETAMRSAETAATGFGRAVGISSTTMQQVNTGANATVDSMYRGQAAATQWNNAVGQLESKITGVTQRMSGMGTMLTTGLQGFTTVAMGINAVSNAVKTLNDDTASLGSKLTSLAMAGTMGISALTTAFSGFKSVMSAVNVLKKGDAIVTDLQTAASNKFLAAQLTSQVASGKEISLLTARSIAKNQGISLEAAETIVKKMNAGATYEQATAEEANNIQQAIRNALALKYIIIAAAVALAIVGIAKAFDNFHISAKEALERSQEGLKNLKEQAQEAKQEAEGIKSAFDNYQSVVDTLYQCTRGTEEWDQALKDVRASVDEIIEKYPELLGIQGALKWDNTTGTYMLDEGIVEGFIAEKEQQANAISYSAGMTEGYVKQDEAALVQQEYSSAINTAGLAQYRDAFNLANMTTDANRNQELIFDYLNTNYAGWDWSVYEEEIAAIAGTGAEYHQLMLESAVGINNASKLVVGDLLADEGLDQTGMDAAAAMYDDLHAEYEKEFSNLWGENSENEKEAMELYAQATGEEWAADAVKGVGEDRRYYIKDETTDEGVREVTEQELASIAATQKIINENLGEISAGAARVSQIAAEVDETGRDFIQGLLSGDLKQGITDFIYKNLTEEQAAAFGNITDGAGEKEADGVIDGYDLTKEQLKILGLDNAEQFNALAEEMGMTGSEMISLLSEIATLLGGDGTDGTNEGGVSDETESRLNRYGIDTSEMSIDEQNSAGNILENAQDAVGIGTLQSIQYQNSELTDEQFLAYADALSKIDKNAPGAAQAIEELNKQYDIQGETAERLAGQYNDDLVFDVSRGSAQYQYDSVQELVGDEPLEQYAQIDQATVDGLADLGMPVDQFFTDMGNGMYELTGNAAEFNRIVQEASLRGYEEALAGYGSALDEASNKYGVSANLITNTATTSDQAVNNARIEYASSAQGIEWTEDQQAIIDQYNAAESQGEMAQFEPEQWAEIANMTAIAAQEADNLAQAQGRAMAELEGFDPEAFTEYANALMESEEALVETREEANRLTQAHLKMQRGVDSLTDGWEDWNEALESGNFEEQQEAIGNIKDSMSDILGVDVSQISDDFATNAEAMEIMERAAQGDIDALDELGPLFAQSHVLDMEVNNEQFNGDLAGLQTEVSAMIDSIEAEDIAIGTSLDSSGYASAMTEMMAQAGVDIGIINDILAGVGFAPEVSYQEIPVDQYSEMVNSGTTTWKDSEGNEYTAVLDTTLQADENGMVKVPVINGSKTTFKGAPSSSGARGGGGSGGGGGGGGGGGSSNPAKKIRKTKKSDIVERYKEVNKQLEKVQAKSDDLSNAMDGLYGKNRLNAMDKYIKSLQDEVKLLQEKIKLNRQYLKEDEQYLREVATEVGVKLTIDNGVVTNYTEVMSQLHAELNRLEEQQNALGTQEAQDEFAEEHIDPLQEEIDLLQEAIDAYEETYQEYQDFLDEIEDTMRSIAEIRFEKLSYSLEVNLELDEDKMAVLEYYFDKMSESLWDSAEAMETLMNQSEIYGNNLSNYYDALKEAEEVSATAWKEAYDEAIQAGLNESEARDLADSARQQAYIDFLREARNGIMEQLEAMNDLDEQMKEFYSDTLDKAIEELEKYTSIFDFLNSALEHHADLIELINGETAYGEILDVQEKQIEIFRNQFNVYKQKYELDKSEVDKYYKLMREAEANNDPNYELYKAYYEAAKEAAMDSYESMMEYYYSTLEKEKEKLATLISQASESLSRQLAEMFGVEGTLDDLEKSMERRANLQEEYLTTTNKIYETEKLMRTAQKAIDESTNSVAKRRLKQFMEETEQLQEQTQLSQFELDIQQAKYDLLLAEIALEEAQNAKSTVRLQRDAEGNFGYVYTADQDKIADAQQQLEDAENKLYNIRLDGANNYAEKLKESTIAMYDELQELADAYHNGEIGSEEEYNKKRQEIYDHYTEMMKQSSDLYSVATSEDARIVADAWGAAFVDLDNFGSHWADSYNTYTNSVKDAFSGWGAAVKEIEAALSGLGLTLEQIIAMGNQTEEDITGDGGVLDAIEDEIKDVNELALEYAGLRKELLESIEAYEHLMTDINELIQGNSGFVDEKPKGNNPSGYDMSDEKTKIGVAYASYLGRWGWDAEARKSKLAAAGFNATDIESIIDKGYFYLLEKAKELKIDWTKYTPSAFDTGGYTGIWGDYGKLGILHEKEMVLNANDTANLLSTMDILEDIIKMIDVQAYQAQLSNLMLPSIKDMGNNIEQNVHIEASFPEAKDRYEIEEAFNNLINKASQYANRK